MNLNAWLEAGWLRPLEVRPEEIRGLLDRSAAALEQTGVVGLANEWRFIMAYDSALLAATAALAACGFRTSRESHHVRVIESLSYTVCADALLVRTFSRLRKRRHEAHYEYTVDVTEQET